MITSFPALLAVVLLSVFCLLGVLAFNALCTKYENYLKRKKNKMEEKRK